MEGHLAVFLTSFFLLAGSAQGQAIDGCPMYGCRPSGTFSFSLDVPRKNASVRWVTDFFIGPIIDFGGCVGNPDAIVCQSNGPAPDSTGYMSLDAGSGGVRWRDPVLRFPTLPVLDTSGSMWGSDGGNLMQYDVDGRVQTQISLDPNIRPVFGTQFLDSGVVLLVSETGVLATWLSDGTPLASIYLKGTVERAEGLFLPVAPPVVNKDRFYVLTEFKPNQRQDSANLGLQRLYAIDVRQTMGDRIVVAWYANFMKEGLMKPHSTESQVVIMEMDDVKNSLTQEIHYTNLKYRHLPIPSSLSEQKQSTYPNTHKVSGKLRFISRRRKLLSKLHDPTASKPSLLFDKAIDTIYVALPPPMLARGIKQGLDRLWGIKDTGNDSEFVFRTVHSVNNMALYESNLPAPPRNAGDQLWVSLTDGKLLAMEKFGNISKVLDLTKTLETNFTITSKITTARVHELDEDFLLFGINVQNPTTGFKALLSRYDIDASKATPKNYVVGIDTPENKPLNGANGQDPPKWPIAFMVPTPEDRVVFGQIIGVKGANNLKDQLLVCAQDKDSAKIFTIQEPEP